ncbi:hypothetical protein BAU14_11575 [Enterococcus sp. CU9D]|nr:hypothetical protein BAU14_11575 [Enterococcus sp. CU9D]
MRYIKGDASNRGISAVSNLTLTGEGVLFYYGAKFETGENFVWKSWLSNEIKSERVTYLFLRR